MYADLKKIKNSVIAIDVGNTSTHFAYFSQGKIRRQFRLRTKEAAKNGVAMLKSKFPLDRCGAVVIASVVPNEGLALEQNIFSKLEIETFLIGKDLVPPIVNLYKKPRQVGIDRLMSAIAAYAQFKKEVIVIDFGTAITFDVISKKGEYLGGVIAPGIEISLDALFRKTALLPKIKLKHPRSIVGKDTAESIRIGCSVGIGGLCDRIVEEICRKYHFKPVIVATGGYANFMSKYSRSFNKIEPQLILKGVLLSYFSDQKYKTLDKKV